MPNLKRNLDRLVRSPRPEGHTGAELRDKFFATIAHLLDPSMFVLERLELKLDPWQERLIRSTRRRIIVCVARQQGKSETAAAKATHRAVFYPKSLVIIVAPVVDQANELLRKVQANLKKLMDHDSQPVRDNKRGVELENGSRILVLAADEDTLRSYTAHMIIVDESATVAEAVFEALEPMLLTTDGQFILLGTPKGPNGYFAKIWHDGSEAWDRYRVTAWDSPRIPKIRIQALRDEKERVGMLWWFHQEYECSFIAAAFGLVYPYEKKLNDAPALDLAPRYGWQYVLGIDYGYVDSTAFVVMGWQRDDPHVYVIETHEKRGYTPEEAANVALRFTKKYPFARIVGDTGGLGKGYVEEARRRFRIPIEPAEKNNKRGYIEIMAGDIRTGFVKVMPGNDGLTDEWQKLPWDEEREMPQEGAKDHLSDAALYAYRAALHYLEGVRKPGPAKGTTEAYLAEADEMLESRIRDVQKKDGDWWEQGDQATWANVDSGPSFLN